MNLLAVLATLDPDTEGHWTADGLPRLDAMAELLGRTPTRKEVTDVAPQLTREAAAKNKLLGFPTVPPAPPADDVPEPDLSHDTLDDPTGAPIAPPGASTAEKNAAAEKMQEAIIAAERRMHELDVHMKRLREEREEVARRHAQLVAIVERGSGTVEEKNQHNIATYLQRQREARAARAARVNKVLDSGVNVRDLRAALVPGSKLDAAMAQRRAPLGGARPAVRVPQ